MKTQGIWEFCPNTGNLVCSSCKFPDSKAGQVCKVSFVYVIVTNHVRWHRENMRSDRENTGNLKMQFE